MGAGPDGAHGAVSHHRRSRFDVRVVPHRRRSPFRLRDWRMRTKLATVLVIPSVAFLVLAGVQTSGLVGRTTALGDFAQQVGIGREITTAVHQLQQERDRSAGELAELRGGRAAVDREAIGATLRPLHEATDRAMRGLDRAAAPLADADASWRIAYAEVREAYDQVVSIRAAVLPAVLGTDTVLGNYNRAVDTLLDLLAEPTPGEERPALSDAVLRYVQIARVKELSSRVRAQLYEAGRAGRYGVEDQVLLTDLRAQQLTALAAFRVAATTDQIGRYDETSVDPAFVAATRLEEQSLPVDGTRPAVLPAEQWWTASEQRQELFRQVESSVLDDAVRQADEVSTAQLRTTLLVVGVIVAVLAVALLISLLVGRSIARSMGQLRGQALRIAQVELPDALDRLRTVTGGVPAIDVAPAVVRSLDEIGELAEAFVAVHRSAVSVAVEQATMRRNVNAMFVNLARRSQVLVERQLELLDDLEREENDPDQLENLFKLDHLAARMRRNDESLLVLAGTESTRRWNRPVGLGAVLLAASAEIEQYQRVRHGSVADLHVVGHAVGELVHLLAELLENATAFSRPDTTVDVEARVDAGTASIEIVDEGLGMSPTALAEANAVLATPPAADVATVERMGLFVVSHLAARLGVEVRLYTAPGDRPGLIARILLPRDLLAATPAEPGPSPVAPTGGARRVPNWVLTPGPGDLPVAGRRPDPPTVPRQSRGVPVRAEDVLAPAAPAAPAGSGWWTRQGPAPAAVAAPPVPPAVPVTGGTNDRGLPVRVPMAQLSAVTRPARPDQPRPRHEPDPEAVGGMLSRLYSGVRRAEAEDTTEIPVPPPGGSIEGGRQ
ncbi:nitrate- and nitrite sensing domain-containing protein [Micromonospora endolithica]|uniref:histidine kinase n=1 Tax=Micromonospora endolithica TaxID=230091 RepID=A0A3A9ZQT2_9ACTN|nr:nitrate- and nitrite sensing domain-containing protein [Micromonospora endolithica]RKN50511.1 HAMP domain-containing protein [Micromonospora endolithica]TWJ20789.1 signal transduction histidine kinase [Micromonospora endolithica]